MSKIARQLVCASVIGLLGLNLSYKVVLAEPTVTSDQTQVSQEQPDTREATQANINSYIDKIHEVDDMISKNTIEIQRNKEKVDKLAKDIQDSQDKIDKKEQEMQDNLKYSGARIRALSQSTPQMELLANIFESKDLGDFFSRVEMSIKIVKYDQSVFAKAAEDKEYVESLKQEQEKSKAEIEGLLVKSQEANTELVNQKELLTQTLNTMKDAYANSYISIQSEDAKSYEIALKEKYKTYQFTPLQNQLQYQKRVAENPGIYGQFNLNTPLYFTQDDIIMYASSFLDVPYLWGGTTPQGFDCSGYVQYVYAHFGVYLPRVSEDQQNVGVEITNPQDLQPGDLLFYGDPAHHVTMYVAPGIMMEAPHTGDIVKVSSIRPYTRARRVVDWSKINTSNKTDYDTAIASASQQIPSTQ